MKDQNIVHELERFKKKFKASKTPEQEAFETSWRIFKENHPEFFNDENASLKLIRIEQHCEEIIAKLKPGKYEQDDGSIETAMEILDIIRPERD